VNSSKRALRSSPSNDDGRDNPIGPDGPIILRIAADQVNTPTKLR
jgi:hypothetical protein